MAGEEEASNVDDVDVDVDVERFDDNDDDDDEEVEDLALTDEDEDAVAYSMVLLLPPLLSRCFAMPLYSQPTSHIFLTSCRCCEDTPTSARTVYASAALS